MPKLFCGIDPGKHGAIGLISERGGIIRVWDMPTKDDRGAGDYDIGELANLIQQLVSFPPMEIGFEWPQTRPGEGAQRSRNFGLGLGLVAGMLTIRRMNWRRVDPNEWKGRMGLPGKTHAGWKDDAITTFNVYFPDSDHLIRGPRGGLKDGRMEALLIAEYLRGRTVGGLRAIAEEHGKNSDAAMLRLFGGRRRRAPRGGPL